MCAKREWNPTGVVETRARGLAPSRRAKIESLLKNAKLPCTSLEDFFLALDNALSTYDAGRRLREQSKPATVRANLKSAADVALQLNASLNALDGNSRQLLDEAVPGGREKVVGALSEIIKTLNAAGRLADHYPGPGGLFGHDRLFLAADTIDAIRTHLGAKPTYSRNGLCVAILRILLDELGDKRASAPHDLVCRALKSVRKTTTAGGPIEYQIDGSKN